MLARIKLPFVSGNSGADNHHHQQQHYRWSQKQRRHKSDSELLSSWRVSSRKPGAGSRAGAEERADKSPSRLFRGSSSSMTLRSSMTGSSSMSLRSSLRSSMAFRGSCTGSTGTSTAFFVADLPTPQQQYNHDYSETTSPLPAPLAFQGDDDETDLSTDRIQLAQHEYVQERDVDLQRGDDGDLKTIEEQDDEDLFSSEIMVERVAQFTCDNNSIHGSSSNDSRISEGNLNVFENGGLLQSSEKEQSRHQEQQKQVADQEAVLDPHLEMHDKTTSAIPRTSTREETASTDDYLSSSVSDVNEIDDVITTNEHQHLTDISHVATQQGVEDECTSVLPETRSDTLSVDNAGSNDNISEIGLGQDGTTVATDKDRNEGTCASSDIRPRCRGSLKVLSFRDSLNRSYYDKEQPAFANPGGDDASTEGILSTSAVIAKSLRRYVKFSTVTFHYHPMILGDNPAVSCGPPVTIDWESVGLPETYDMEIYERQLKYSMRFNYQEYNSTKTKILKSLLLQTRGKTNTQPQQGGKPRRRSFTQLKISKSQREYIVRLAGHTKHDIRYVINSLKPIQQSRLAIVKSYYDNMDATAAAAMVVAHRRNTFFNSIADAADPTKRNTHIDFAAPSGWGDSRGKRNARRKCSRKSNAVWR